MEKQLLEQLLTSVHGNSKPIIIEEKQRVKDMTSCWIIISHSTNSEGYVLLNRHNKKNGTAHRLVLEALLGREIEKGLTASHLCEKAFDLESRRCVNPDHLVEESLKRNFMRSQTKRIVSPVEYRWAKYYANKLGLPAIEMKKTLYYADTNHKRAKSSEC